MGGRAAENDVAPEALAAWQRRRTLSSRLSFSQPPPPSHLLSSLRTRLGSTHSTTEAPEGASARAKPRRESSESVDTTEQRHADVEPGDTREQQQGLDHIDTDPSAKPSPTHDGAVDMSEVRVELDADVRSEQAGDDEDKAPSSSHPRRLSLDDSSELGAASV
jgi:hypothetical protein